MCLKVFILGPNQIPQLYLHFPVHAEEPPSVLRGFTDVDLQPGESKTLTGLEVARMKVGNAGGIEIQWNGKPVGPIGTRGQVKTILFTPDNLQILEPTPTPEPSSETL